MRILIFFVFLGRFFINQSVERIFMIDAPLQAVSRSLTNASSSRILARVAFLDIAKFIRTGISETLHLEITSTSTATREIIAPKLEPLFERELELDSSLLRPALLIGKGFLGIDHGGVNEKSRLSRRLCVSYGRAR